MDPKALRLKSQAHSREMVNAYWNELKTAPAEGRPVCWSTMQTPVDLLTTLGYSIVYPENYAATCSAMKVAGQFCALAEDIGFSPDTCSYARNSLGAALSGRTDLCPMGGIPKPDVLICLSYCSAVVKWYEELSRLYSVPLIVIEYPFLHDNLTEEEIVRVTNYTTEQLKDAVPLLESIARRPLDFSRFQEHVANTAAMVESWNRVLAMSRRVPSPVSCFDLFFNLFPMACFRGKAEGVAFVRELEAELEERVANGIASVPGEKFRLYWDGIPIWYRIGDLSRKFAIHGANVVSSIYLFSWAYQNLDPSKPFESSLPPQIRIPDNLGVARKTEFLANLLRDYSLNGIVVQTSRSCKLHAIGQYDRIGMLKGRFSVPVMTIEADMCDDRTYSEARIDSEIASFFEVLASSSQR